MSVSLCVCVIIIMLYLNRPISKISYSERQSLSVDIELNWASHADDCTRCIFTGSRRGQIKLGFARDGVEGAIQGQFDIAVVGADGIMDSDEVGAIRKGALDLDFLDHVHDVWQHMASAQHLLA